MDHAPGVGERHVRNPSKDYDKGDDGDEEGRATPMIA